jgi:hypothetical protein
MKLYSSPDMIRILKSRRICAGHAAHWGAKSAYRVLVRKPKGKIPLGRPTRRWEDSIQICLGEIG